MISEVKAVIIEDRSNADQVRYLCSQIPTAKGMGFGFTPRYEEAMVLPNKEYALQYIGTMAKESCFPNPNNLQIMKVNIQLLGVV